MPDHAREHRAPCARAGAGSGRAAARRGRRRRAHATPAAWAGPGTIMPTCLRTSLEVLDQIGVAGVEADPDAGQVRPLRQRVHGDHAVEPVLEDRAAAALPRELDVALVGEHRHVVGAAPRRRRTEVVERAGRVAGAVDPQRQRPRASVGIDRVEVELAARRQRHRHRPADRPGSRPSRRSGRRSPGTAPCRGRGAAA